ncbi:MAG: hypothetical protein LBS54_01635 [Dysgonamonadaceae bacterium]|jgi:hypothetical protein|nr:hypothetical protein [Dysgonamonadaceae bacterium]
MKEEEEFIYDDEAAVGFIRNSLPEEMKTRFSDDTVYYILDVICDFYDANDYLISDDEEKEERELVKYIISQAVKDKIGKFTEEEIRIVLAAESAYSDTLDIS